MLKSVRYLGNEFVGHPRFGLTDKVEYSIGQLVRYLNRWQRERYSGLHPFHPFKPDGHGSWDGGAIQNGQVGIVVEKSPSTPSGNRSVVLFDDQVYELMHSFLTPIDHPIFSDLNSISELVE